MVRAGDQRDTASADPGATPTLAIGQNGRIMIVVVEGPTAAGKTSWVTTHHSRVAVWEYRSPGNELERSIDPEAAARSWAEPNAGQWQQALDTGTAHGLAVCDTDPFKLHYVWGLW